jgi:hypothetical protein
MAPKSKFQLNAWKWGLSRRLLWAIILSRGNAEKLAEIVRHVLQSHQVQNLDLTGATKGNDRFDVLSIAAQETQNLKGLAMEFGVFQGVTLKHIAHAISPGRQVIGFDTFEGLPDDWGDLLEKGTFATKVPTLTDYPNATLQIGRIENTLPTFLKNETEHVSLLHIDCPYYEINMFILERVLPFMPPQSIIVFDEFYGYPSFEMHEYRAWKETCDRFNLEILPITYSSRSAAFKLESNPSFEG